MRDINIINRIKNEYPKNGYKKTANLIGISLYVLKKIIKDNNIILPNRERRVEFSNFANISKKEVAYFLGFFWSDGYISKNEISLTIKNDDSTDILKVLNTFGKWRIDYRIKKFNGKDFKQACIRINDKKIKEFLLENDYGNKSLMSPSKILSKIPDDLKSYFFRGLIDGDGCFCSKNRNYFSITGNIEQNWFEINNLFKLLNIKFTLTRKERITGNSSYIIISSKRDIIKLGNYIYDNYDYIGLNRKYIIYKEIKDRTLNT